MKRNLFSGAAMLVTPLLLGGCVVAASSSNDNGGGGAFFLLIVPFVLLLAMTAMFRRRRPRRAQYSSAASPSGVNMLRAELSVLADDVLRLEPQVALHEGARDDYESAAHRYRVAQAALEQGGEQVDLTRVQRVVDEASWAMARVRARIDGREPPAPPSALQRPGTGGEQAVRLNDGAPPVYVGSREPFRSGWFGGGAGLFGGLLLGPMLGGFGVWDTSDPDQEYVDDPVE